MEFLPIQDVERIARLLAEVGDPTVDISVPDRKRMLVEGIADLVDADMWIWAIGRFGLAERGDVAPIALMDGGWRNEAERTNYYRLLTDPSSGKKLAAKSWDAMREQTVRTFTSHEIIFDSEEEQLAQKVRESGFFFGMVVVYPVDDKHYSGIGLHRRVGRPDFTERERAIAHVVFLQVHWLHRYGTDVPGSDRLLNLTARERQVMMFLIGGDSQKEIAHKLELSPHTIGDYIKRIYQHFSVSSRAELLARFISGGIVS